MEIKVSSGRRGRVVRAPSCNRRIMSVVSSSPVRIFLNKKMLSTLLSTGWSQTRSRETGDFIGYRLSSQSSLNIFIAYRLIKVF